MAKLIAGHAVRRLRRQMGITQAAMAEALGVSASYLNLIERNQRPVSATVLVRLAERFDFDARALGAAEPGGGAGAMRRRLADPLFADLEIDRAELEEWLAAAPGGAEAFARAFDRSVGGGGDATAEADDPVGAARREIERWRNHFPDLDAHAEGVADELRMGAGELGAAVAERLRVRHSLSIRVLPVEVMPDVLRRLDLHARQLQLSELLDPAGRTFAMAFHLALIEARGEIDALARGAALSRVAERLFRRHLANYWAAALTMPYARFLRACEATGYDIDLLARRFGAGWEQVAHRLTTLSRVGARGLPFFMIRIDRAGQVSKRYVGASGTGLVEAEGRCPLWRLLHAFDRPGETVAQLVEPETGGRVLTIQRTVTPQGRRIGGVPAMFAIGLGVAAEVAGTLAAARGIDLAGAATPIGPGCRACLRPDCAQRSAPPAGRALTVGDRERRVSALTFAGGLRGVMGVVDGESPLHHRCAAVPLPACGEDLGGGWRGDWSRLGVGGLPPVRTCMFHLMFGLPCLYVLVRFLWPLPWAPGVKIAVAVVLIVASQYHLWSRLSSGSVFAPEFPRGVVILFNWAFGAILLLAAMQLMIDIVGLATMPLRRASGAVPPGVRYGAGGLAMLLAAIGVYQAIRVPPLRDVEIAVPGLAPQFDGYRLVQLTDLHITRLFPEAWTRAVVDRTNALDADLIVVTGDLIDGSLAIRRADVSPLADLRAADGVWVIPGNHEYYFGYETWMRHYAAQGMRVLANGHHVLTRQAGGTTGALVLAGVTDVSAVEAGRPGPDLAAALAGAPAGVPVLLLDHQPRNARDAAARGVAVQLSGHTHGGMILGFDRILALFNAGFVSGRYSVDGMTLYVNNGTALWPGFALRLGRPSELTRITLRRAPS